MEHYRGCEEPVFGAPRYPIPEFPQLHHLLIVNPENSPILKMIPTCFSRFVRSSIHRILECTELKLQTPS